MNFTVFQSFLRGVRGKARSIPHAPLHVPVFDKKYFLCYNIDKKKGYNMVNIINRNKYFNNEYIKKILKEDLSENWIKVSNYINDNDDIFNSADFSNKFNECKDALTQCFKIKDLSNRISELNDPYFTGYNSRITFKDLDIIYNYLVDRFDNFDEFAQLSLDELYDYYICDKEVNGKDSLVILAAIEYVQMREWYLDNCL